MAAYVIVDIEVTDPAGYEEYRKLAAPAVAAFGGKFLVRGGPTATLEGNWRPKRVVLLEFPDVQHAQAWWASEEYRAARAIRQRTAVTNMVVAEGIA
ncbi:MAG TPA: DUF1330 domain-containing protein [Burkholderiales bacterium]|jgi:uncharacterized protein (DUF1330 family)|nr:DUF1330 domain-containing protein [Burkholderiales bacterium]